MTVRAAGRARRTVAAIGIVAAAMFAAGRSGAQDFAVPGATPALDGDLLERALPGDARRWSLAALHVRRPLGLASRALIAGAAPGIVRLAAGIARTGDDALGWSTAAAALGFAVEGAGAGLRLAARRDDDAPPGEERDGVEAGLGGWLGAPAARGWISAPQVWLGGAAPPLARGLTAGLDLRSGDARASLAREAPRRGFAEPASWRVRLGLELGGIALWAEGRDHPWRGGVGVRAVAGPVECLAQVDAHPVLDPTTRLAIRVGRGVSR